MPMPKLCVLKSEQEAALARTTKPMQVRIPRRAASVLAAEVERRIARGVYPSAESLIGEAVTKAFAGGGAPMRLCSVAGCGTAFPGQADYGHFARRAAGLLLEVLPK